MADLSAEAWDARYVEKNTPWDTLGPTPEFVRIINDATLPLKPKSRILIPGAGRGYDSVLFAKHHEVDILDFAPTALNAALELSHKEKAVIYAYRQNFFDLAHLPYHRNWYDLVLEYTFFCAIDPAFRKKYVETVNSCLKKGGIFLGLFFPTSFTNTNHVPPPYLVSKKEVEELFSPYFDLEFSEPLQSIKARAGREFLGTFRKR